MMQPDKNIPEPLKTREQILETLNGIDPQTHRAKIGPWAYMPRLVAVSIPEIGNNGVNFLHAKDGGIVLLPFINAETGELKTFVAKYLDVPERENLF